MTLVDVMTSAEVLGFAVCLVLLYNASHSVRYYIKFFAFIFLSLISATIFIPLMFRRPKDWRNALLPAWGARQISRLLGLTWHVRGLENVVKDSGCVVLINHQSGIDLLVLAELWPIIPKCTMIAKKEIFYLWPFGLATWLWGTVFIDRLDVDRARDTVNKTGEKVLRDQVHLCMFPEGTRHDGETLRPFKKGAFHVAIASQTPIQPVVVSRYDFLDHKEKIFNPGTSYITILPPIPTEGLTKEDLPKLMTDTREKMDKVFKISSLEKTAAVTSAKVMSGFETAFAAKFPMRME